MCESFHSAQKPNYAFKPIAEQALRPNQTVVPQRLNAALDLGMELVESSWIHLSEVWNARSLRFEL